MIRIEQRKTEKVPGETSLFISFDYNKEIVDTVKSVGSTIYNKKKQEWESPISNIRTLISRLSQIDSIDLICLKDKKEKKKVEYKLHGFKTNPFPYQIDGIQYGLNHDKWLLLDPPGLGKSLTSIYIAQELKHRENIEHCLIVCGINTLKSNWRKEIKLHSDLDCRILGERTDKNGKINIGSIQDRLNQLKNPIKEFFVITNIETLRNPDIVKEINSGVNKFDIIIADELHKMKSPTSQQGKGFLKLNKAKYKIGLTGTLLLNNPLDAYVPLRWIDADRSTYTNFKYYYCNFGGPFNNILQGFKNTKVLKEQVEKYSLRRPKELLNLPPKTIIHEVIEMGDTQKEFYKNITKGIVSQVDKVNITTTSLLAMMTRLRQATSCPSVLTTENIDSSKIDRACDLVEEIVEDGNKVVIFSSFKETLNVLQEKLQKYKPLLCTGDIKDSEISDNIDSFQSNDTNKVMLCTISKMGTGVTLTKASYCIFIDSAYTDAQNLQCEDRIYRIGSDSPVFIYYLWNDDSVDMRVKEIVENKSMISDYIVDDKCSPQLVDKLKQIIEDLTDEVKLF